MSNISSRVKGLAALMIKAREDIQAMVGKLDTNVYGDQVRLSWNTWCHIASINAALKAGDHKKLARELTAVINDHGGFNNLNELEAVLDIENSHLAGLKEAMWPSVGTYIEVTESMHSGFKVYSYLIRRGSNYVDAGENQPGFVIKESILHYGYGLDAGATRVVWPHMPMWHVLRELCEEHGSEWNERPDGKDGRFIAITV